MTLVSASLSGASWNVSWLDGVPSGGLCDGRNLLWEMKTSSKLKDLGDSSLRSGRTAYNFSVACFCSALCRQGSDICLVSKLPEEAKTKLQQISTFHQGHIVVFQRKEETALLFTAWTTTGATGQCLFRKPACVYLLTGPARSHEIRELVHYEACTTIPSCHLEQALHQPWLCFLCMRSSTSCNFMSLLMLYRRKFEAKSMITF